MGLPIHYHKRKIVSMDSVLRNLFINTPFSTKKQLAKANCSVLQGGTRRKSNVIYIIDEIFSFIHL
ncbi:hypothetical protein COM69_15045 [Bacillus toyonensis]|nr:hypothetical protein COM69_15045 [Bacillus toyonensis]PHD44966.1 hypothetical protein COF65_05770 [Bacillus toyonensis]